MYLENGATSPNDVYLVTVEDKFNRKSYTCVTCFIKWWYCRWRWVT